MKFKTTKYTLPAYWASYLINGDDSGMEPSDKTDCAAFLARHRVNRHSFVDCGEQWFAKSNDANNLAGDVCEFTHMEPIEPKVKPLTDKQRLDFILTYCLLLEGMSGCGISWEWDRSNPASWDRAHLDAAIRKAPNKPKVKTFTDGNDKVTRTSWEEEV